MKKIRKKVIAFVMAGLLALQAYPECPAAVSRIHAQETFANIHALYDYWCENSYANYPDNVGNVYMCYDDSYYDEDATEAFTPAYDPYGPVQNSFVGDSQAYDAEYDSAEIITSHSIDGEADTSSYFVGEPKIESMEEKALAWTIVIGLLNDTPEEEQKILSLLQDQSHVAFTSCNYSYKELCAVQDEIAEFFKERNLDSWGAGITCCGVERSADGKFTPMRNYVEVNVSYENCEEISHILMEKYGDKIEIFSMETAVDDAYSETKNGEIGVFVTEDMVTEPNSALLSENGDAMLIGKTYTWKNSADEKTTWKVTPAKRVKILKESSTLKFKAKKTGWVTVTAKTAQGKETKKVLILNKNGVVASQKQLMTALNSSKIKSITIKTSKKKEFTIPEGDYGKKKIIVNAKNSSIFIEDDTLSLDKNLVVKTGNVMLP